MRRVFSRPRTGRTRRPARRRDQREAFLNGWTRKEAYLKATGLGITEGLQTIEVTLDPDQPPVLRHPATEEASHDREWTIHDLRTDPSFAAALVIEGARAVTLARYDVADFPGGLR